MLEIQKYWAHALNCNMAQVCMPGISIVPMSENVGIGEKKITIVKSRLNSVLLVPEEMLSQVRPAIEKIPRLIGVSAKRLTALIDPLELQLEPAEKDYIYYLEPGASLIDLQDGRFELFTLSREGLCLLCQVGRLW